MAWDSAGACWTFGFTAFSPHAAAIAELRIDDLGPEPGFVVAGDAGVLYGVKGQEPVAGYTAESKHR